MDEAADLRNKTRALDVYAKQAQNVEAERRATEIRLRAERRTGELLKELARTTPVQRAAKANEALGRSPKPAENVASPYAEALASTGISAQTAHRYQALANVPAPAFEDALRSPQAKPTTNGILRAANGAPRMDDGAPWVWVS